MSFITFQCYACNQVLQVGADKAGRKAKCSQCGTILTIPALAPGAVAESVMPVPSMPPPAPRAFDDVNVVDEDPRRRRLLDDEDEPQPRRRHRDDDFDVRRPAASKWDKIKIGFLLVFIGLCVMAGAYGVELIGRLIHLISYASGAFGGFSIATVFVRIGLTVGFIATIAAIVGHVFWLFVSNRTGAMGFGIAALAVCSVYLIFQLVGRVMPAFGAIAGHRVMMMLAGLLGAGYFMMIGFYVRSLSLLLDRRLLQSRAMLLIILSSVLAGYELLSGIILLAVTGIGGGLVLMWILFWLGAVLTVVVFVFTLLTVFEGKRVADREAESTAY